MTLQVPAGITLPDYAETADPVSESESRQQQSGALAIKPKSHSVGSVSCCWRACQSLGEVRGDLMTGSVFAVAIRSAKDIEGMRVVCRMAREILDAGHAAVRPGVTTDEIDRVVCQSALHFCNFTQCRLLACLCLLATAAANLLLGAGSRGNCAAGRLPLPPRESQPALSAQLSPTRATVKLLLCCFWPLPAVLPLPLCRPSHALSDVVGPRRRTTTTSQRACAPR